MLSTPSRSAARRKETVPAPEPEPDLYTVKEAAFRLSTSTRQVWRLIADGDLETVRVGARAVRVPRVSLTGYIARQAERERDLRG